MLSNSQKIVLNAGGLSFVFVLFFTAVVSIFTLFQFFLLSLLTCLFTFVIYKISSPSFKFPKNITNAVRGKTRINFNSQIKEHVILDKDVEKLDTLKKLSDNRLLKLSTVFPFKLFKDTIVIEQKQVTIEVRNFFLSSEIYPISIKDIMSPVVSTGIFFATFHLELGPGGFHLTPPVVSFLRKEEALRARRVIMGLIICDKEGIDLTKMNKDEVLQKLDEVGNVNFD